MVFVIRYKKRISLREGNGVVDPLVLLRFGFVV